MLGRVGGRPRALNKKQVAVAKAMLKDRRVPAAGLPPPAAPASKPKPRKARSKTVIDPEPEPG